MRTSAAVALVALAVAAAAQAGGPSRVYRASLAYAKCMRAHGVPQPNPDRNGDIHLTAADEQRLRKVGRTKVQAADAICFDRHLKGVVSTKPLSPLAQARAIDVLRELAACMKTFGYVEGDPIVRNLSRGRAFFGFDRPARGGPPGRPLARAQSTCERRVKLAPRID